MILIPKKKAKNKFRPINLASCKHKVTQELIQTRLTHFLENNNDLPDKESGFRKSRPCSTSIAALITEILNAFVNNIIASALFVSYWIYHTNILQETFISK